MSFDINIQRIDNTAIKLTDAQILSWAKSALLPLISQAELTIRIVDAKEMQGLNNHYRHQDNPTNVLSFPSSIPEELRQALGSHFIGDIILCPSVLAKESVEQAKLLEHHWAHIVIHGVLHLLGYDHIDEADEKKMQAVEIQILHQLGIDNPYE